MGKTRVCTPVPLVNVDSELNRLLTISAKHSGFSSSFPVYLWETETKEVPDEEAAAALKAEEDAKKKEKEAAEDDDEAVIEDEDDEKKDANPPPAPMKYVTIERWSHINAQPPLWQRDPKNITDGEAALVILSSDTHS